jgi:DNA polymerase-3 subunit delta
MPPSDASSVLAAAKERPRPVYLLIGEPFQTEAVARALIDGLVPAERRSFNLETYDGRTTSVAPVLDSLRMRGLFPGTKVVWVREPTLFLSGEKRTELSAALFTAWAEERRGEAGEKLLTLAALAGWDQQRFAAVDWTTLSASEGSALLGRALDEEERPLLEAVRTYCLERRLTVSAYRDESGLLQEFLAAGVPADAVLIFTAEAVDRRKRVFKTIADVGVVLELALARERSGALTPESVEQIVRQVAGRFGKRLTPAALRLVQQQAGGDGALLAAELEKLCLYAGEAGEIGEDEVRASLRDLGESWIFDFTKALAQREVAAALTLLRGLFARGEPPLRLLAMVAREIRLLLIARDCLATLGRHWNARMPFAAFRDRVLPCLDEMEQEALAGVHPYVLYLTLQHASRTSTAALQRALLALQDLDVKLKSSGGDPRLLFEAFVLDLTRGS